VVTLAGDRIKVAGDILQFDELFVEDAALTIDPTLLAKRVREEARAIEAIRAVRAMAESSDVVEPGAWESQIKEYMEGQGIKLGVCIQALRVALTGKSTGLGVFDLLFLLGNDRVRSRIDRCIAMCG
jgi:glutamyl-tRNA synthetase